MSFSRIQPGGDIRGDWAKINDLGDDLRAVADRLRAAETELEQLRKGRRGVGGGSVKAYKVQSGGEHDDYLVVKEWAGGAETGSALNLAKPPYLRIASKPSASHTIKSAYATGTILYGTTVDGGTDVTVSSVGVDVLDLNVDARKWAYEIRFCEGGVAKKADADMGPVTTV